MEEKKKSEEVPIVQENKKELTEEEKKPEVSMAPGITPTSAPSLCSRTLCSVVTAITWHSDMNSCHSWHLSTSPESTAPGQQ